MNSDIYAIENFDGNKELAVVSFVDPDRENYPITDFFLVWTQNGETKFERIFCTAEDALEHLSERTAALVREIQRLEFVPQISQEHRKIIAAFLKG